MGLVERVVLLRRKNRISTIEGCEKEAAECVILMVVLFVVFVAGALLANVLVVVIMGVLAILVGQDVRYFDLLRTKLEKKGSK